MTSLCRWKAATSTATPCCMSHAGSHAPRHVQKPTLFLSNDATARMLNMWPCSNGHMRIVKMLLRAGAAVNSENLKGQVRFEYEQTVLG